MVAIDNPLTICCREQKAKESESAIRSRFVPESFYSLNWTLCLNRAFGKTVSLPM